VPADRVELLEIASTTRRRGAQALELRAAADCFGLRSGDLHSADFQAPDSVPGLRTFAAAGVRCVFPRGAAHRVAGAIAHASFARKTTTQAIRCLQSPTA